LSEDIIKVNAQYNFAAPEFANMTSAEIKENEINSTHNSEKVTDTSHHSSTIDNVEASGATLSPVQKPVIITISNAIVKTRRFLQVLYFLLD